MVAFLFVFIGYLRHRLYPIRRELLWCLMTGFGGGAVELLLVNIGHAWTYASPNFYGIPLYMPIFWAVIAAASVSLYQGVMVKK